MNGFTGDGKESRNGADEDDDVDGKSISGEEDVDGVPLDGAALLKSAQKGSKCFSSHVFVESFKATGFSPYFVQQLQLR